MKNRLLAVCSKHRLELLLFGVVFFSYGYFYNGAGWNQNSRLNTIFAFVEPDTTDQYSFRINQFISDPENGVNTGDWAKFGVDYYSNKAPGPALLGIPLYFGLFHLETAIGIPPLADGPSLINAYLIHLLVTVLPISIAAIFFFQIILNLDRSSKRKALFFCACLFSGTLIFPYSTQLWGHVTAAAFVIIAYSFYLRGTSASATISGIAIGFAVLSEYSCAICLAILLIALLAEHKWRMTFSFLLGGLIPLFLFAIYHKMCFGQFITVANVYNNPYFLDTEGLGNIIGLINPKAVVDITVSPYRGLFFYMPVLIFSVVASVRTRFAKEHTIYWLCIANILGFLLMNFAFNGWHGGACIGPRYQIPVLPFYVILMTLLPKTLVVYSIQIVLLLVSSMNMLLATIISPIVPSSVANPLARYYEGLYQMIFTGQNFIHPFTLPVRLQSRSSETVKELSAFNLGEIGGLTGLASLLPWIIVLSTATYLLYSVAGQDKITKSNLVLPGNRLSEDGYVPPAEPQE